MSGRKNSPSWGVWFILIALGAVWAVPLLWTFLTALRPPDEAVSVGSMIGTRWTLENFARAWSYAPFARYFVNTITLVVGIFVVQMVTLTMAAFAFARMKFPGRDLLFLVFLLQLMVPAEALVVPNFMTLRKLGLNDNLLGVMLPYMATALGTFLVRQTFRQIPDELEEAAVMDGANIWQILWKIFVPMAKPSLVAFGLVSVSYHWNNFFWPMIVTNSPEKRPLTVGLALFAKAVEAGADWSLVMAGTVIVILPLLAVFVIFQRQFISSFMHSGIK